MLYEIQRLPDMPVLIGTWYKGFKYVEHGKQYVDEIHTLLDALDAPLFYVIDLSQLQTPTLDGIINAANSGVRGLSASLRHPMNRGTLFISHDPVIHRVVQGLQDAAFGSILAQVFETLDEALAYVNDALQRQSQ